MRDDLMAAPIGRTSGSPSKEPRGWPRPDGVLIARIGGDRGRNNAASGTSHRWSSGVTSSG
jgi:hypothetical protein